VLGLVVLGEVGVVERRFVVESELEVEELEEERLVRLIARRKRYFSGMLIVVECLIFWFCVLFAILSSSS